MDLNDSFAILLIGGAGNGKSSTGNTIIGIDNTFIASNGTESVTQVENYAFCEFEGKTLKVVDCPGLGDTRVSVDVNVQQLTEAIKTSIANNPAGFNAIIYVLKFPNKFDQYVVKALEEIKSIFGENFIKKHCILLMTRGDCFETDPEVIKGNYSFDQWVQQQQNPNFKTVLMECQERIILFDNRTKDEHKRFKQMKKLIRVIESLGNRYTNKEFEEAALKRNELLEILHSEAETLYFIDRISILGSRVKNARNDEGGLEMLMSAKMEFEELKRKAEYDLKVIKLIDLIESCLKDKECQVKQAMETAKTIKDFEMQHLKIKRKIMGSFRKAKGKGLF